MPRNPEKDQDKQPGWFTKNRWYIFAALGAAMVSIIAYLLRNHPAMAFSVVNEENIAQQPNALPPLPANNPYQHPDLRAPHRDRPAEQNPLPPAANQHNPILDVNRNLEVNALNALLQRNFRGFADNFNRLPQDYRLHLRRQLPALNINAQLRQGFIINNNGDLIVVNPDLVAQLQPEFHQPQPLRPR